MARKKKKAEVKTYYDALEQIFSKQSEILTAALPHYGERGRNDEERLRDFLTKVLPSKFSVGTGFIVCHKSTIPHSSQTDIVIYDEIVNSPLHRELSAYVYPIEVVYATIEVKGAIKQSDIYKSFDDIGKIRRLAKHKWYVNFGAKEKVPGEKGKPIVAPEDFQIKLSPRACIFAYDTTAWKNIESFKKYLRNTLLKSGKAHLHGAVILNKGWFVYQEAYEKDIVLRSFTDNALLRFIHKMTYDIESVRMHPMSLDEYFGITYGAS